LSDRARNTPSRVAIDFAGERTTYGKLAERSSRMAVALTARGVVRGDRIATLTLSSPDHVALLFACARLGAALQPLNWRLAPAEIRYQLDDAEPALLAISDEHVDLAGEAGGPVPRSRFAELDADGVPPETEVSDDDPLLLSYTSGTTGKPKGAVLTHANCFWANLCFDRTSGISDDDVVLQVLPQFHSGGWNVQPLLAWWKGATVVLEPSFEPVRALRLIEEKRVTTMMGVPATYLFMAEQPGFADTDLSSLRLAVVGGAPMPESLLRQWQARGVGIVQGYGLTEAAPNVLCLPPEDAARKLGYAGKPYPHIDVALRDPEDGSLLEGPGTGELVVKGPNVFAGYWRNPEATATAFADGWLLTGDLAERDDDGYYRIAGRLKDLVISGGENIYPAEIEDVLHAHPDVSEAAVIGIPDERWGEVCLAFVSLRAETAVEEEALLEWCRGRLARFKVPKGVRFVDVLPRSAMNKVLKDELRASATAKEPV
ncbi:MAG: long-chain fatty acid--CoA ligase, partial [Actinomycetota bacterium]|nr:long-chain fatty acid--CoA ligase [Actinomycetota bacterium]